VELLMSEWTGELMIDLRNMRDWSVGDADLTVGRDTVIMRHGGRHLASMDRDHFRDFLTCADPEVYQVDEVKWTVSVGATCLETGHSFFTVHPDSVRQMVGVI
jgi:hypothetical protein